MGTWIQPLEADLHQEGCRELPLPLLPIHRDCDLLWDRLWDRELFLYEFYSWLWSGVLH